MTNAQRDKARAHIAEAITEQWGERCRHFDGKCPCCLSWAEYDRLRGRDTIELVAAGDELEQLLRLCQAIMTGYLIPDGSSAKEAMRLMIAVLDGPRQRKAQAQWVIARDDAELNAIADERAGGPTVAMKLEDL